MGQWLDLPAKASGPGIGVNGGALLFFALATCYGNDTYRDAATRSIEIERVKVDVRGEFGGPCETGRNIRYSATSTANAPEDANLEPVEPERLVRDGREGCEGGDHGE